MRQMVFRPVSGGNGEKSLTDGESSVKGTDTVGQQRVGDDHVRDNALVNSCQPRSTPKIMWSQLWKGFGISG